MMSWATASIVFKDERDCKDIGPSGNLCEIYLNFNLGFKGVNKYHVCQSLLLFLIN